MNINVIRDFAKNLEPATLTDVRTVVVNDEYGQPLVIAQELGAGKYVVSKSGDRDFADLLRALGLNKKNVKYVKTEL